MLAADAADAAQEPGSGPPPPFVDWRLFGRHRQYANGTPRSLLRGWVHVLALASLELLLLASASGWGSLPPLPPRAALLARWTTLAFYGSVLFHLVPYAREESYNVALSADFMAITLGFTGQVAAWVGLLSCAGLLSVALSLAKLALCVGGLVQSAQPLWQFHRITRRNIVFAQARSFLSRPSRPTRPAHPPQFALTSLVEAFVIPNKALVGAIWLSKWVAFSWYVTHGRHDARPSRLAWAPHVWADHDYFHLLAICTAALQLAAAVSMG